MKMVLTHQICESLVLKHNAKFDTNVIFDHTSTSEVLNPLLVFGIDELTFGNQCGGCGTSHSLGVFFKNGV